jgi:uncharacterized protein (DUF1778 family)
MGQVVARSVRRRGRSSSARSYVVKLYLSLEERELLRAGAAAAGVAVGAFVARAALDAASAGVEPAGARTGLEGLARLQFELAGVRRRLDQLRAALTADQASEATARVRKQCAEAARELTELARVIHRRLGAGG